MKITNMTSDHTGKKVANQFIVHNGDIIAFQSYESMICEINHGKRKMKIDKRYFDYSKTTNKYFHKFLHNPELIKELRQRKKDDNFKPFDFFHDGNTYKITWSDLN